MMYYPLKSMLSKKERDYLSDQLEISKSYQRVLNHKIRKKLREFYMLELPLIQRSTVTEFGNAVTENGNATSAELGGPEGIRTPDLTLRKRSHYPCYATSPSF